MIPTLQMGSCQLREQPTPQSSSVTWGRNRLFVWFGVTPVCCMLLGPGGRSEEAADLVLTCRGPSLLQPHSSELGI